MILAPFIFDLLRS